MRAKTPWHLWVTGVVTLFWNAFGAMDYIMTQTRNEGYLAAIPQEQMDYFFGFPTWYVAIWAIAIWTSVLGSLLLLLRMKLAVPVFLVSVVSYVINWVYTSFINVMPGANTGHLIFSLVIFAVLVFSLWYSSVMKKKGVLR
jgi:hypothetical protein